MGIQKMIQWGIQTIYSSLESVLTFIHESILGILKTLLVTGVLLWTAVFLYGSFYISYMPEVSHERDINFFFRSDCTHQELCSFPAANVSLMKEGKPQLLKRGQVYQAVIELEMPESEVNRNLGMFMVTADFYAKDGEVKLTTSRATMLYYKSRLLYILDTLAFCPLYLMGYREQKQLLTVELSNRFHDDPFHPIIGVYIEIQSKRIEIYAATIKLRAVFEGLRYWLYHWPLASAVSGVALNLVFLLAIALISWARVTGAPVSPNDGMGTLDGEPLSLDDIEDTGWMQSSGLMDLDTDTVHTAAAGDGSQHDAAEEAEARQEEADIVLLGPEDVHGDDQTQMRRRGPPRV